MIFLSAPSRFVLVYLILNCPGGDNLFHYCPFCATPHCYPPRGEIRWMQSRCVRPESPLFEAYVCPVGAGVVLNVKSLPRPSPREFFAASDLVAALLQKFA